MGGRLVINEKTVMKYSAFFFLTLQQVPQEEEDHPNLIVSFWLSAYPSTNFVGSPPRRQKVER